MIALTFAITASEPLLLTALQGDPNSAVSLPYIPGSVLRGMFIGAYLRKHGLNELDLTTDTAPSTELDQATSKRRNRQKNQAKKKKDRQQQPDPHLMATAKRLFFDQHTQFLNAYPSIEGQRSLPLPRSLRYEKRTQLHAGLWDSAATNFSPPENRPLKGIKGGFGLVTSQGLQLGPSAETVINIHTARHRGKGRATREDGAVFRYEALAPGQTFQAAVICQNHADAQDLQALFFNSAEHPACWAWIGGSRSAGYGKVNLETPIIDDTWNEYASASQADADTHTITLLSDLILRDQFGSYGGDLSAYLKQRYCLEVDSARSSIATTIVGGFNRKWGLPLPQAQAFAMGSTLVVKGDISKLHQRIDSGLGERRYDGFGRIALNWRPHTEDNGKITIAQPTEPAEPAEAPAPVRFNLSNPTTELVVERILRQRFEQRLLNLSARLRITGDISPTQLARLWLIARNSIPTADLGPINELLAALPSNARGQFERASVEFIIKFASPSPSNGNTDTGKRLASLDQWLKAPTIYRNQPNQPVAEPHQAEPVLPITDQDWEIKPLDWPRLDALPYQDEKYNSLEREYTLRLITALAKIARKQQQKEHSA